VVLNVFNTRTVSVVQRLLLTAWAENPTIRTVLVYGTAALQGVQSLNNAGFSSFLTLQFSHFLGTLLIANGDRPI
jgi:hypothetical protein